MGQRWARRGGAVLGLLAALLNPAGSRADDVDLQVVAALQQAPGNITVTSEGRIIVSLHQFYGPAERVVEVLADGRTRPFPTPQWASAPGPDGTGMQAVLGIRATPEGIVWMLDNGSAPPQLVGWDTKADGLYQVIPIPAPASIPGSFLNDFAVDGVRQTIIIADFADAPEKGALVVVDLQTGQSRRVLHGDRSTRAEDTPMVIDGRRVTLRHADGRIVEARVAVNPITIDGASEWVYYGAMHGRSLWRVRAADLVDPRLSAAELAARVERFGDKPLSDGISIDTAGNVYVTDLEANGLGVTAPDGRYRLLVQDAQRLSWPDAIAGGPDGRMYVAVNQLHRSPPLNEGVNAAQPPFYIVSFQPLAAAIVGR